jgi:predicted nuclease with TOPRIM domain
VSAKYHQAKTEIRDLQEKLDKAEKERDAAIKDLADAQQQLADAKQQLAKANARVAELEAANTELSAKIIELERTVDQLNDKVDIFQSLVSQNEAASDAAVDNNVDDDEWQRIQANLDNSREVVLQSLGELQQVQLNLATAQNHQQDVQDNLDDAQEVAGEAHDTVDNAQAQVTRKSARVKMSTEKAQAYQEQLKKMKTRPASHLTPENSGNKRPRNLRSRNNIGVTA